jgi:hypothetical protein
MAGQRGAAANPALIARQAAMQGANTQQQAVGQSAQLQAQQQLAAQQNLANLSAQQTGQQAGAISGYNQAAQGEQGSLLGAIGAQNNANVGMQSNLNSTNAQIQNTNAQGQNSLVGGLLGGVGNAVQGLVGLAGGGEVVAEGPQTSFGKYFSQPMAEGGSLGTRAMSKSGEQTSSGVSTNYGSYSKGGRVKAMLSPDELYLTPKKAQAVALGKLSPMAGERIPGKAKVAGDSLENDTVPRDLEAGGVVVKRSQAQDPDKARSFVQAVMAHSMGPKRRK